MSNTHIIIVFLVVVVMDVTNAGVGELSVHEVCVHIRSIQSQ